MTVGRGVASSGLLIVAIMRSPFVVRRNRQRDECRSTARRSRVSLLMSRANAGCVDGMRAIGRLAGISIVVSARRTVRLGFPETGRSVWIVTGSGIVPVFQLGVIFVALNQG